MSKKLRILIADDESIIRLDLKEMLEDNGHTVVGEATDGKLAVFSSPDRPDRPVALKRRGVPELLAEELRHLDEDDIYASVTKRLLHLEKQS